MLPLAALQQRAGVLAEQHLVDCHSRTLTTEGNPDRLPRAWPALW